jgi:TonB family protein
MNNQRFHIALIISLLVHTGVLIPQINFLSSGSPSKNMELTYIKTKASDAIRVKKQLPRRDISLKEKELSDLDITSKVIVSRLETSSFKSMSGKSPFSSFAKERVFKKYDEFLNSKPQLSKPDVIAIKKRIALTPIELNKINSPAYISYSQITREKIKRCAYQYYTSQDTGEVFLSFVISADGSLIDAKIIEDKSTPNAYLKEIAVKSLKGAAKFPVFPKDLDYPELSFNVIISFQAE